MGKHQVDKRHVQVVDMHQVGMQLVGMLLVDEILVDVNRVGKHQVEGMFLGGKHQVVGSLLVVGSRLVDSLGTTLLYKCKRNKSEQENISYENK